MNKLVLIPVLALILLLIDWYAFQAVKTATQNLSSNARTIWHNLYWGLAVVMIVGLFIYHFVDPYLLGRKLRTMLMVVIFTHYFAKFFILFFLIIDEIWRIIQWIGQKLGITGNSPTGESPAVVTEGSTSANITRSQFLAKAGLIAATVPIVGVSYGIISGAHDYRVRRRRIVLPNLPKEFDGMRLAQISDVHSGSFWNRTAVQGGVEMLMKEKPDMIFFTGDLVNNVASEMKDYVSIFGKLDAPHGVYSTLGNHDYGDYVSWSSPEAKAKNLQTLIETHRAMGWDILMDEHRVIKEGKAEIGVLGIQNWSAKGRFPKYGSLAAAHRGTENLPVKLLLSHDPSHWMGEVVPQYKDVDVTFSGHTHGMQFGVDIKGFRWSPVKYVYPEWADLYQSGEQYLYVNRGFGYLGFPGRVGIPPEITIVELVRA
ncbi:MAG: metallophosphoesterase [Bacteroidota bacterium]